MNSPIVAPPALSELCNTDPSSYSAYCLLYREYLRYFSVLNGERLVSSDTEAGSSDCGRGAAATSLGVGSGRLGDAGGSGLLGAEQCVSCVLLGTRCVCACQFGRAAGVNGELVEGALPVRGGSDAASCAGGDSAHVAASVGCGESLGVNQNAEVLPALPGRWARSNRRKKEKKKKTEAGVPLWRRGAGPPGLTVLSAEREARDTLAQRRAAENKVAKKLAEMKLASLEDEKKCQEYADLKHQRVIQWTNEATAKSQQSLDKVKSIDPSSSASQYEIRQQAKELADTKATLRTMTAILKELSPDFEADMEACRPCGTEEFAMYAAAGGYSQFSEEIENAPVRRFVV